MKFIFPKNYNYKNKIFGVIDYPTAIFHLFFLIVLIPFSNILFSNFTVKSFFVVVLYLPVFLFSIANLGGESIVYKLFYLIVYLLRPKLYLYK